MLHILGIGTAVGQTALKKSDFEEIEIRGCTLSNGESRRSALGKDYLAQTKNADIEAVKQEQNQSPTDLCLAAATAAIAEAGISAEQLGLVIGDCATPWQTTPSEGQRVADRLGLKIPAYDIGGGGIVPQHLSSLSRWRIERVPEYTLLLSGSTPTTRIDFKSGGQERWQFGDAACACVVSTKHRGKFAVIEAESLFHGGGGNSFVVDQFAPLAANVEEFSQRIEQLTSDVIAKAIFKHKLHGSHVVLACGEASAGMAARVAEMHSISRLAAPFAANGCTLSSGCFLALQEQRASLRQGDRVILAQALPGFVSGYALCEVM